MTDIFAKIIEMISDFFRKPEVKKALKEMLTLTIIAIVNIIKNDSDQQTETD